MAEARASVRHSNAIPTQFACLSTQKNTIATTLAVLNPLQGKPVSSEAELMSWVRDSDPHYGSFAYSFDVYRADIQVNTCTPAFIMFLRYGFGLDDLPAHLVPHWLTRIAFGLRELGQPKAANPIGEIYDATRRMFPRSQLHKAQTVFALPGFIRACTWQHPGVVRVAFDGNGPPHFAVCLGPQGALADCNDEIVFLDPVYGVVVTPYVVPRGRNHRMQWIPYDTTHNSFGGRARRGTIRAGVFSLLNPVTNQMIPWRTTDGTSDTDADSHPSEAAVPMDRSMLE